MNLICANCEENLMLIERTGLEQDIEGNYFYVTEQYCLICGLRLKTKVIVEVKSGEGKPTFFDGHMKEVRFYNSARTPAEVAQEYK